MTADYTRSSASLLASVKRPWPALDGVHRACACRRWTCCATSARHPKRSGATRASSARTPNTPWRAAAFAVAFGDDVLLGEHAPGANLAAMREKLGTGTEAVMAGQHIDRDDARSFSIIDTANDSDRVRRVRQRPAPETATEPTAVVSRLILRPSILARLRPAGLAQGEVNLGVAAGQLATEARIAVHRITGQWVTLGERRHYLDALNTYWQHRSEMTGVPRS